MNSKTAPNLILHNARLTTLDAKYLEAKKLAIKDGRWCEMGCGGAV